MSSHRYWRAQQIEASAKGALVLTEFQLLNSTTRQDAGVVLTANIAPDSGSLSALQDGAAAGAVTWNDPSDLVLSWDFGVATEVNNIRLGAATDQAKFAFAVTLQWSDDGTTWTTYWPYIGIAWPGNNTLTSSMLGPARLRDYGVMTYVVSGTSIELPMPATILRGDLLVATLMRRSALVTTPAGWTLISTVGPSFDGVATSQWVDVFAKEATGSEGPITFVQTSAGRMVGVVVSVQSDYSVPTLDVQSTPQVLADDPSATTTGMIRFSELSPGLRGRLAVPIVSRVGASPGAPINLNPTEWTQVPPLTTDESRLAVGYRFMGAGQVTTGQATDNIAVSAATRWTSQMLLFAGGMSITRNLVVGRSDTMTPTVVPSAGFAPTYGEVKPMQHPISARRNYYIGGQGQDIGRVRGTVKEKNTPVNTPLRRRVRLIREVDGLLIRETWSDAVTGAYDFQYVSELDTYTVISYDHEHNYRAVVADNLTPELMP